MSSEIEDDTKKVRFGSVETREYPMTLGANPATKIGVPVCLDWEYRQLPEKSLGEDGKPQRNPPSKQQQQQEQYHPKRNKSPREFYLNYYQRKKILETAGFSQADLEKAENSVRWDRTRRKLSEYQSYPVLWIKSWKVQFGRYKTKSFVKKYQKEHGLNNNRKSARTRNQQR